jgi:hypothetical protein
MGGYVGPLGTSMSSLTNALAAATASVRLRFGAKVLALASCVPESLPILIDRRLHGGIDALETLGGSCFRCAGVWIDNRRSPVTSVDAACPLFRGRNDALLLGLGGCTGLVNCWEGENGTGLHNA